MLFWVCFANRSRVRMIRKKHFHTAWLLNNFNSNPFMNLRSESLMKNSDWCPEVCFSNRISGKLGKKASAPNKESRMHVTFRLLIRVIDNWAKGDSRGERSNWVQVPIVPPPAKVSSPPAVTVTLPILLQTFSYRKRISFFVLQEPK